MLDNQDQQAQSLIAQFRRMMNSAVNNETQNGVVKFLQTTVKSLEGITKKIDKFLKSKNIDIKEQIKELTNKGTGALEKTKDLFSATKEGVKQQGLFGFVKNKADVVKTSMSEAFKSDETSGAPPNSVSKIAAMASRASSIVSAINPFQKQKSPTTSSVEDYEKAFNDAKARAAKRQEEVAKEKEIVRKRLEDKQAKAKSGNWITKIMGAITGLGKFVVGGIGKIALAAIPASVRLLSKSLVGILGRFVPALSGSIAKSVQGAVWSATKVAGRGAWAGAKAIATKGLPLLWGGVKALGGAVATTLGATGLAIAGGVVAAGLLIYGGYKLYKYLNRNNIDNDIFGQLTRLRLLMYGFNETNKDYYYKLLELEMMMKDYVGHKDGRVFFVKFDADFKEKIRKLFEVGDEEKEKFQILNNWFMRRFLPSFKAFMEAYMPLAANAYLDKLDKLTPAQTLQLASTLTLPASVFSQVGIPVFNNPKTTVVKQEADDLLTSIRDKAKKGTDELSSKSPAAVSQAVKKTTSEDTAKSAIEGEQVTQSNKATISGIAASTQTKSSVASGNNFLNTSPGSIGTQSSVPAKTPETPQQEGEIKPPEGANPKSATPEPTAGSSAASNLKIAPGPLQPGDKSLQGIAVGPKGNKDRIFQLHPKVFKLFTGMAKEYNSLTGKNIVVNESFRTYEDQMALKRKYHNKAAKPGNSIHEFGMAIDINSYDANQLDSMGLLRKYGFTRPVGGETWHLEPAGVAINPQAAKSNPQLREQAIDSSPGRGGGGYGETKSTPLGKRNIPLQKRIYAEGSADPVDVQEMLAKNDEKAEGGLLNTPGAIPEAKSKSESTSSSGTTAVAYVPEGVSSSPSSSSTTSANFASASLNQSLASIGGKPQEPTSLEPTPKESNTNLDTGKIGTQNLSPVQAIHKAANLVGMEPNTMVNFAKLESSLDPKAGAKTSSAKGLFQITKATWEKQLLPTKGPQYGVPPDADIFDPYYNSVMGIAYAKENARTIIPLGQKAGLPDEVSLYMAHHFGPSGGSRMIKAYMQNPNQPTQDAVSEETFKANKAALAGKTVGQYMQSVISKMQTAASTPASAYKGMKGQSSDTSSSTTSSSSGSYTSSSSEDSSTTLSAPAQQFSTTSYSVNAPAKMERFELPSTSSSAATTPVTQSSTTPVELAPQPSAARGLNTSEEILNNQLGVLKDIKSILEVIAKSGDSMHGRRPMIHSQPEPSHQSPSMSTQAPAPAASPTTVSAPLGRVPSTRSVSMSRRPITT